MGAEDRELRAAARRFASKRAAARRTTSEWAATEGGGAVSY